MFDRGNEVVWIDLQEIARWPVYGKAFKNSFLDGGEGKTPCIL